VIPGRQIVLVIIWRTDECSYLWSSANILTESDSVCFHLYSQGHDLQQPLHAYKCQLFPLGCVDIRTTTSPHHASSIHPIPGSCRPSTSIPQGRPTNNILPRCISSDLVSIRRKPPQLQNRVYGIHGIFPKRPVGLWSGESESWARL
jgi:hypothetical protein